ncbi:coiled-coil domain-containing protein 12 [Entomortierella parvispora]|uniref:Coiled-coil domain-containing protein 12 n=1 Tax=Entomortierella parvispora TaxID=205924 RepID=A0A9P3LV99_9FUNG|nr:coiled-coil domain-containing protein 12 [Entomortierella parvispora]
MDEASRKRKERLEQLKKRKAESMGNGDQKDVSLSFRNYTPLNAELKAEDSKITTPKDIGDTVEKKMEGVVEKVIQEEDEKRAKDVDIFSLAPKKPNWDLKRDIEPSLLKLEKKTRAAIIELIRKERPGELNMA